MISMHSLISPARPARGFPSQQCQGFHGVERLIGARSDALSHPRVTSPGDSRPLTFALADAHHRHIRPDILQDANQLVSSWSIEANSFNEIGPATSTSSGNGSVRYRSF
jgi:hypothetical protein